MRGIITIAAVCAFGVVQAWGGMIPQSKSFSGTPNFAQNLIFDQFDDLGGTRTLQSIEVQVLLNVDGGSLKVDNDGEQSASGAVVFGAEVLLTSTVSLVDASIQNIIQPGDVKATGGTTLSLTADDGDTEVGGSAFFSYAGTDYGFYDGGPAGDSDSGFVSTTVFGQYIGTGTYTITVNASQIADYGALGGVQAQIDPLSSSGYVKVIYTYVPEPATLAAMAMGSLALLRRRR